MDKYLIKKVGNNYIMASCCDCKQGRKYCSNVKSCPEYQNVLKKLHDFEKRK